MSIETSRWAKGRDPEKVRRNKHAYKLRHPDRVQARSVARWKAFAALPWDHPERVKHRERQIARYYREKSRAEGPKPAKKRSRHYKMRAKLRKYGLTPEQYDERIKVQKGLCAICNRPERALGKFGKVKELAVDHCHTSERVRGLLCQNCNIALGGFEDNPNLLRNAIAYLQR